jgi:SSS family solute:Na+ symporter
VTKAGAFAGIAVGVFTVAYITISASTVGTLFPALPQFIKDLNVGVIALVINLVVTFVVSFVTKSASAANNTNEHVA